MKHCVVLCLSMFMVLMVMPSCHNEQEDLNFNRQLVDGHMDTSSRSSNPLWERHHDSCLKILAIGNSFTINATTFMPWLVNSLNGDSICIGRLTRSGGSLQQLWENHESDIPDYDFYYSDKAGWQLSDINP